MSRTEREKNDVEQMHYREKQDEWEAREAEDEERRGNHLQGL